MAAMSSGPKCRSMNCRAALTTTFVRSGATLRSSSTITYRRPLMGWALDFTSLTAGVTARGRGACGRQRDVDEREGADFLRLAVFEQLEIIFGEISDEVSALVGHHRVDVDEIHLNLKCRGGRGLLLRSGEQRRDHGDCRQEGGPKESADLSR